MQWDRLLHPLRERRRRIVLRALAGGPLSTAKLQRATGIGSSALYSTVLRLVDSGEITAAWDRDPEHPVELYIG